MTARPRKPAIFSPDDPNVVVTVAKEEPLIDLLKQADAEAAQLPAVASATRERRWFPWRKVLFGAAGGLISLSYLISKM